jgi:hypothetical protein
MPQPPYAAASCAKRKRQYGAPARPDRDTVLDAGRQQGTPTRNAANRLLTLAQAVAEERWRHYSPMEHMSERCPMRRRPSRKQADPRSTPAVATTTWCDTCWRPGLSGANKRQRTFADVVLKVEVRDSREAPPRQEPHPWSADQTGCRRNRLPSTAESDARACRPAAKHFQVQNDEVTQRSSGWILS